MNVEIFSYASATAAYFVLTGLAITTWRRKFVGLLLIMTGFFSFMWALQITLLTQSSPSPKSLILIGEFCRVASWQYFLWYLSRSKSDSTGHNSNSNTLALIIVISNLIVLGSSILPDLIDNATLNTLVTRSNIPQLSWITTTVVSILLVEQLYRGTPEKQRPKIKQLCFALCLIFMLDFYLYTDTLLFNDLNANIWSARGIVNALVVPIIAVSAARNPDWALDIHVSRTVVTQSFTLVAAGVYLLLLAAVSYTIRTYGNSWAETLRFVVLFAGTASLVAVVTSSRAKAHLQLFLSQNFFSHKYDYRKVWLEFTDTLTNEKTEIPVRIIQALSNLVESPGGTLWLLKTDSNYTYYATTSIETPQTAQTIDFEYFVPPQQNEKTIFELDKHVDSASSAALVSSLCKHKISDNPWILIALVFQDTVIAFVVLEKSPILKKLDWEELDLLNAASNQAAGLLKQYLGNLELVDAKQFEAFNRLSAYVVHDLKNILNQQSLIVCNAARHKQNPEFIDDVINTVDNSVQRMTVLMAQLRTGIRVENEVEIDLAELIDTVISKASTRQPTPQFSAPVKATIVFASKTKLSEVFGHLIQNAQEATKDDGTILVELYSDASTAFVTIRDDGKGMSAEFVRHRLYKAFDTTKGLTGMGIGVFESREYVNSLGGDIHVSSTVDKGSTFTISIPLFGNDRGTQSTLAHDSR